MTAPALDLVALVRELVGRPTVSGDAAAQRDTLGTLTDVLRGRAPHLQVTEGDDRDHPWALLRTPATQASSSTQSCSSSSWSNDSINNRSNVVLL